MTLPMDLAGYKRWRMAEETRDERRANAYERRSRRWRLRPRCAKQMDRPTQAEALKGGH